MKKFVYLRHTLFLGEYCRVFLLFGHVYLAISQERKRFVLDVVF